MPATKEMQNLTVRLSRQTIHKARVLAAKRSTSISNLVAEQIEHLTDSDEDYENAKAEAFAMMDKGFHLGGDHKFDRAALHDRR
jgi:predicted DNA-binding protein